jgi:hypothetical protein
LTSSSSDTNGDGLDDVIANPDGSVTVDLLALQRVEVLFSSGKVEPGHYTQIRLRVVSAQAVEGAVTTDLKVPSGAQTGLKISLDLTVDPGQRATLLLDFDADKSIVVRGNSGKPPILKPHITVVSGVVDCSTPAWTSSGDDQSGAWFGYSLRSAGDVNGDGYDDVIVGSVFYDTPNESAGKAYLFLGGPAGLPLTADWTSIGDDKIDAYYGSSVSGAGDVNNDGFDDVIIGAHYQDTTSKSAVGKAFLYLGGATGLSATPAWTSHGDERGGALFGSSVASAGDVDQDGFDDVIIGAAHDGASGIWAGRAYVYLGDPTGLALTPVWTSAGDDFHNSQFGGSVASAGDVNGDTFDDVIVGAHRALGSSTLRVGKAFVYTGGPAGPSTAASWTSIGDDEDGAEFGWSVDSAGDVDGDTFDDVIIGARRGDGTQLDAGKAYLFRGSTSGLLATPAWTTSGDDQEEALVGHSLASAGDVNMDGYGDVVIGAYSQDTTRPRAGKVFVYIGGPGGLSLTPFWSTTGDEHGCWSFGHTVAPAGDVYNDGYDRILVGVPWCSSGTAFLFCGHP